MGPKRGLTFGGGLTFGFIHFAVTSPFPTQKMSEPMLLDDLQLEETDTIDEVESSDDSEFEVVEAPVNDEEPEQPELEKRAFGFSEAGGAKQVRGYVSKKQEIMGLLAHMRSKNKSLRSRKQVRAMVCRPPTLS